MSRLLGVGVLLLTLLLLTLCPMPATAVPRPGFGWPLAGVPKVERGFEPPRSDYGPGHRGVDLRAFVGEPVLAAGAGRVSYAGLLAGRGVVTVTHVGGLRTTYEPVVPSIAVGALVTRGAVLGRVSFGHASCRGSACLHWGLLRGRVYLDPLSLVAAGQIRLLPVGGTAAVRAASRSATWGRPAVGSSQVRPEVVRGARTSQVGSAVRVSVAASVLGGVGVVLLRAMARRRQDAPGWRGS